MLVVFFDNNYQIAGVNNVRNQEFIDAFGSNLRAFTV